ncbi:Germin [Macleaya cordata]|uniref:Germin-like protein n=1 Tax=Macleaya cordata TaxID=56857 RepID=A0A200QEP6_MACCD|nr:Germin [Macleaya cordata]
MKRTMDYSPCFIGEVIFVILALLSSIALATDPGPLQDFCVALDDPIPGVFVNGEFCKDPMKVNADDFFLSGLNKPGNITNQFGAAFALVTVPQIPGLNTLGISMVRMDYAPYGLNPPHTNPRGSEILLVLEGTLLVGFVTSNPDNRLFTKILHEGDVFVFPIGLIHFQFNVGKAKVVAISALSSQGPGYLAISNTVFGSTPPINDEVLTKAFQIDSKLVDYLQSRFSPDNN